MREAQDPYHTPNRVRTPDRQGTSLRPFYLLTSGQWPQQRIAMVKCRIQTPSTSPAAFGEARSEAEHHCFVSCRMLGPIGFSAGRFHFSSYVSQSIILNNKVSEIGNPFGHPVFAVIITTLVESISVTNNDGVFVPIPLIRIW
jgi:hypothetical protein